jgi:hypothetical protein
MTPQQLSDYACDCDYVAPDSPEPDYRYVVKLVLSSTLYFRDGHTPETRHALRSCFEDFFAAFGKELRWGWDPQPAGGKLRGVSTNGLLMLRKQLSVALKQTIIWSWGSGAVLARSMSAIMESNVSHVRTGSNPLVAIVPI